MCCNDIEGIDDNAEMSDFFQEQLGLTSPEEYTNLDQDEVHDSGQEATELYTACELDSDGWM